jgi:hypothetical protein
MEPGIGGDVSSLLPLVTDLLGLGLVAAMENKLCKTRESIGHVS